MTTHKTYEAMQASVTTATHTITTIHPILGKDEIIFISVVGSLVVILVIFLLYITETLCFKRCGGLYSIWERKSKDGKDKLLVHEASDSSDSESSCQDSKGNLEALKNGDAKQLKPIAVSRTDITINDLADDDEVDGEDIDERPETKPLSAYGDFKPTDYMDAASDVHESGTLLTCGKLNVTILVRPRQHIAVLHVLNAEEVPNRRRGGCAYCQIRITLLPDKKQREKTRVVHTRNANFDAEYTFPRVFLDSQKFEAIRFRLYGCERTRRERLLGEAILSLTSLAAEKAKTAEHRRPSSTASSTGQPKEKPKYYTIVFESRVSSLKPVAHHERMGDFDGDERDAVDGISLTTTGSSQISMQADVRLGLVYNGNSGRLTVEVIQCSGLGVPGNPTKPPDAFVRCAVLMPNGQETSNAKTSLRREQRHPSYRETFMFSVPLFQLRDSTLVVCVYHKRPLSRRVIIGWVSLGLNSSGDTEQYHWQQMTESHGNPVCGSHYLLEPSLKSSKK